MPWGWKDPSPRPLGRLGEKRDDWKFCLKGFGKTHAALIRIGGGQASSLPLLYSKTLTIASLFFRILSTFFDIHIPDAGSAALRLGSVMIIVMAIVPSSRRSVVQSAGIPAALTDAMA